jgi:hypothetical protein
MSLACSSPSAWNRRCTCRDALGKPCLWDRSPNVSAAVGCWEYTAPFDTAVHRTMGTLPPGPVPGPGWPVVPGLAAMAPAHDPAVSPSFAFTVAPMVQSADSRA